MAESGYPGFEAIGWASVLAPRDTPPAVTNYLSQQITPVLGTPEMQKFFRDRVVFMHQGREHKIGPPEERFTAPATPKLRQFLGMMDLAR